jgi:hypothetical protein
MTIPEPPRGDTPAYRQLVAAHAAYIRGLSHRLLERVPLSPGDPAGRWVPYALYHHIFQLCRANLALVDLGYSEEALPLGRAMISTTMNLMHIVRSANADGWALRFWLQLGDQEQRMLARERQLQRFDPGVVERLISDSSEAARGAVEAHVAQGGIYPDKLVPSGAKKPNTHSWHGLTDRDMAMKLGLIEWYETEYDFLSTMTHARAIAVLATGQQLMRGEPLTCGPHFRAPLAALTCASNALKYSSLVIMRHFELESVDPECQALNLFMREAVTAYRQDSGADDGVRAVFGRLPV